MNNLTQVFVYGTLKRGEPNHHWLTDSANGSARMLCRAATVDRFPLVIASRYNIPYLINAPGSGKNVEGEVYEVDEKMLSQLDVLEDHPKYYKREVREMTPVDDADCDSEAVLAKSSSGRVSAWVYLLHTFKPAMLELPSLHSYSAKGDHGLEYVASDDSISDPEDIM